MTNSGTPDEWISLEVTLPHEMLDAIADFCHEHGSGGVVVEDDNPSSARIKAYFPVERWEAVRADLQNYMARLGEIFADLPKPAVVSEAVKNENWAIAWKDNFKALPIGKRLIVTPPWLTPDPQGREVIVIDPAAAFGTGTHETTQGCLVLLEEAVEAIRETNDAFTMLDLGCGSGILAIAAGKLGATEVLGVDNDQVAVESAVVNRNLNDVEAVVRLRCASLKEVDSPADIVAANLDPMTLLANRDLIVSLVGRFLIISGVPLNQWTHVKDLLVSRGVVLRREITRSEWGCGLLEKA